MHMRTVDRIGRRLSLRDLNILMVVAESRSMSKAADRLAVSQPVVSKAISSMEHALGVALLDRSAHGVELTPYGKALLARANAVFDEIQLGLREIDFLKDPTAGHIRVGGGPPTVAGIVPAIARQLVHDHPRISIEVVEGALEELHAALRNREVDLVIGRSPLSIVGADDLHAEVLFNEGLLVVAGARSKWARRSKLKLAELLDEPWVMPPPNSAAAQLIAELFDAAGVRTPRPTITAVSMAMNIHLVISGPFLALLPASTVLLSAKYQPLKALRIALPALKRPVTIATLKNRTLNPVAQLFIERARTFTRLMFRAGDSAKALPASNT